MSELFAGRLRAAPVVLALILFAPVLPANAGLISSPDGGFSVEFPEYYVNGSTEPPVSYGNVGSFFRTRDFYDPIWPGTGPDGWGLSFGTVSSGFANPEGMPPNQGASNIIPGAYSFGEASATFSARLIPQGEDPALQIDQTVSFAAENVLRIRTTLTNCDPVLTHAGLPIKYRRVLDWDIDPVQYQEMISLPGLVPPVTGATYSGFDTMDPLKSFLLPGGGSIYGPGDYGAGLNLSLGTLAPGQATTFDIFEAINLVTGVQGSLVYQTPDALRNQLSSVGAAWVAVGWSYAEGGAAGLTSARYSAALGYGPVSTGVPEPGTTALFVAALGLLAFVRRRKPADA